MTAVSVRVQRFFRNATPDDSQPIRPIKFKHGFITFASLTRVKVSQRWHAEVQSKAKTRLLPTEKVLQAFILLLYLDK